MSDDEVKSSKKSIDNGASASISVLTFIIITFFWVWLITGLIGFLASLVCFGYNGSIADKFLGVLIVLVIGPFYWLYFIFNSNYCTRYPLD